MNEIRNYLIKEINRNELTSKKCSNTYHSTIKMKPADVKSNTNIYSSKEINGKNPKFKIGDTVRISKYQNVFAKDYTPDWNEEFFVIKKVKNILLWT